MKQQLFQEIDNNAGILWDMADQIFDHPEQGGEERFRDVIKGASLMAGVTYDIAERKSLANKIPVLALNDLMTANAKEAGAPGIKPPREKTGSTDFGNVMHEIPGSCIRVKFVPTGTSSLKLALFSPTSSESLQKILGF